MMNEKCLGFFFSEFKPRFKKKMNMNISLYRDYFQCQGVTIAGNTIVSEETLVYNIPYEKLKSVEIILFQNEPCLKICFTMEAFFGANSDMEVFVPKLENCEECKKAILKRRELFYTYREQQRLLKVEQQEKEKQYELDAADFYHTCCDFHMKEGTPSYTIYEEKNRIVAVTVDEKKGLTFLKIDGYEKSEDVGVIPYDKIHYYEKAGNVHYVSDIKGNYSSFGGSLTGATFSKRAALLHGILFGPMGMATAALMSYKPAEQKPAETHFDIQSQAQRIDERNVILNFYSDEKKQYLDIELPQDIYNFLQTYLPEKRYVIVSELEKHEAIQQTAPLQNALEAPAAVPQLPEQKKLTLDEFKEKVEKLKLMYDAGFLTDEEFTQAKAELLSEI